MTEKLRITLLVHTKIAVFEWGKSFIDIIKAQAQRKQYIIDTVYDAEDVRRDSVIVILAVDKLWIENALDIIGAQSSRLLLVYGVTNKSYEYISHLAADQQVITQQCLNLLHENGKKRTAFFGLQENDTSDQLKAITFLRNFPDTDVYTVKGNPNECFDMLISALDKYDSIICSNDVMAIYLIGRLRSLGINIPERLELIGNGNLWLSSHVTPQLTTVSCNYAAVATLALQICENLYGFDKLGSINVSIGTQLIQRESTGAKAVTEATESFSAQKRGEYPTVDSSVFSPEISDIVRLDRALSSFTKNQRTILKRWIEGASAEQISDEIFISEDTVKYHLKSIYKLLGIHSKNELLKLANKYGLTL